MAFIPIAPKFFFDMDVGLELEPEECKKYLSIDLENIPNDEIERIKLM